MAFPEIRWLEIGRLIGLILLLLSRTYRSASGILPFDSKNFRTLTERVNLLHAQPRLKEISQGCDPSNKERFKVRNPYLMYAIVASQAPNGDHDKLAMFSSSSKASDYIDFSVNEQAASVTGYGFSDKDFEVLAKADAPVVFCFTYLATC